jgi:hypothetical protein
MSSEQCIKREHILSSEQMYKKKTYSANLATVHLENVFCKASKCIKRKRIPPSLQMYKKKTYSAKRANV